MKVARHRPDPRETTAARIDRACHDVNTSLSTVILCIEFLAERSDAVGGEAALDARGAVRRISSVMAILRDDLKPEDSSQKTSAVFRRSDRPGPDERPSEPSPHS